MQSTEKILESLRKVGEKFTYQNFGFPTERGYVADLRPTFITWHTRLSKVMFELFSANSSPIALFKEGNGVRLVGNGEGEFKAAMSYYMAAIEEGLNALKLDAYGELRTAKGMQRADLGNKVFVVHGHDEQAKLQTEAVLHELGLEPVVLHRMADQGQTILEKFEKHSDVGFAVVILTPDEIAYLASDEQSPEEKRRKERRARPNVIFEFGYFVGRLGRSRVCCLYRGDVAIPSDLHGLLYKKFNHHVEEVAYQLIKELKTAGYRV